jgi:adenylate cyclase
VAAAPAPNSVAVLYFANASRDSADAYLADGITEEIATSLARIARLHVVSPVVVRRAQRASGDDPARLARALGVRHLVEGSVRRAGLEARITARLLGPDARTTLWTDAYTRPTSDLLALEAEIAQQVASGVVGALLPDERRSLAAARVDPEAHDHVLRGNFLLARRSVDAIRRAIAEYEAAVAADSLYAAAWGRLALGHALLRFWAGLADSRTPEAESLQVRGERAAARSLQLDSSLSDSWAALGYLRLYRDPIGMRGVLGAFRRAVAGNPNSAEAHHQLGTGYLWYGDTVASRVELLRALELEPGRLVTFDNLSTLSLVERRFAESLRWADSALAVEPTHTYALVRRAMAFALLGDSAGALLAAESAERLVRSPDLHHPQCVVLGMLHLPAARPVCNAALGEARSALDSAEAYVSMGDVERAATAYAAAVQSGRSLFLWLGLMEPYLEPLQSDPRFPRLMEALRPAEGPR